MENLLNVRQVAQVLGVPDSWIYGRVHARCMPFPYIKVGRYLRFDRGDVRQYLDKQRSRANGSKPSV